MADKQSGAVLVVDDDRLNRIMLSKLLETEGYQAVAVVDGTEALEAVANADFDVVLLDIVMPGIDGIEVLQRLKCDSRTWDIPVIMISAVEETTSIARCIELGAEDYLLKPFDPVLLRARINACLARKRFHDLEVEYHKIVKEQAAQLEELNRELTRRLRELERLGRSAEPPVEGSG
jgi:adenylate cyclase